MDKVRDIHSIEEIFKDYDFFIFDMDGVIWEGDRVIEDGVNAVNFLIAQGKNVCFYTNNSSKSRQTFIKRLRQFNINPTESQVYSSCYIAAMHAKETLKSKKVYVLGMEGIMEELQLQGIGYVNSEIHEGFKQTTQEDFRLLETDADIDCVVYEIIIGYDERMNYRKICYASKCIQKGAHFLACNVDASIVVGEYKMPAGGSIAATLERAVQKKATFIGKPETIGYKIIASEQNIEDNRRVLMIGDNVETDIQFAINNGLDSLVVLTGVSSKQEAYNSQATYIGHRLFN